MVILRYLFFFLAGILMNMGLVHLVNFAETSHHPIIARTKSPNLASTLWGLGYAFFAGLILLLLNYQFQLSVATLVIYLGFGSWAIFLAVNADRRQR